MSYISLEMYVGLAGLVGFSKLLGCDGFIRKLSDCGGVYELNLYSSSNDFPCVPSNDEVVYPMKGLKNISANPEINIETNAPSSPVVFERCTENSKATIKRINVKISHFTFFDAYLDIFPSYLTNSLVCSSAYRQFNKRNPIMVQKKHKKLEIISAVNRHLSELKTIYKVIDNGITRKGAERTLFLNRLYCLISLTGSLRRIKSPYLFNKIITRFFQLRHSILTVNKYKLKIGISMQRKAQPHV